MTTDRELLELAAKAVGVVGEYESWTGQGFAEGIRQVINGARCHKPWNPLNDDGDALRLAVQLGLTPLILRDQRMSSCAVPLDGVPSCSEPWGKGSDFKATRRAIVRAAAAMAAQGVLASA